VWDHTADRPLELMSMGIRVNAESMTRQHKELGLPDARMETPYHRDILEDKLPATVGGGIGQSRVAMFLLRKKDIASVQAISTYN